MKVLVAFLGVAVGLSLAIPAKNGRIIGGEPAFEGEFPSIAALQISKQSSRIFCQGALLNQLYLVTVAHCVVDALEIHITLGSISLTDPTAVHAVTDTFIIHPGFNPLTYANDIALIRLHLPISLTDYIQPISLPPKDITQYSKLKTAGWGQLDDNHPAPVDELHHVDVTLISDAECRRAYGNAIQPSMACVEGNYNEGTCRGDSGAPLFEFLNPRQSTLVGLSTFISQNGCQSTDPSGFTKVYPFLTWINSNIH